MKTYTDLPTASCDVKLAIEVVDSDGTNRGTFNCCATALIEASSRFESGQLTFDILYETFSTRAYGISTHNMLIMYASEVIMFEPYFVNNHG